MDKQHYIAGKLNEISRNRLFRVTAIGAGIVIFLSLHDFFVIPEQHGRFLIFRLAASSILLAVAVASRHVKGSRKIDALAYLAVVSSAAESELMILNSGGQSSFYYAGMILLYIVVLNYVPSRFSFYIYSAMLIYSIYLFPILATEKITDTRTFLNANIFMGSSFCAMLILKYLDHRSLLNGLGLQYDLNQEKRKIEESEMRFRAITATAADAVVVMDQKGRITFWNRAAETIFGYSQDEVIGKDLHSLLVPKEYALRYGTTSETREEKQGPGAGHVFECRAVRKDGTEITAEISIAGFEMDSARHTVGTVRDVTERRHAEDQLRKSKDLSDALGYINTVIHSTLDVNTIMQNIVNEAAEAIQVDACSLGIFQNDRFAVKYVRGLPAEVTGRSVPVQEMKALSYAVYRRDVTAFGEVGKEELSELETIGIRGVSCMVIAPLIIRDDILGAMSFYYRSVPCGMNDLQVDFVRKLSASLSLSLENAFLYEERKRIEERMRHMAHHDALTGLPNRRLFMEIAGFEFAEARRYKKKAAILFLDLDRFKEVNDTLGHEAGDELLRAVTERLKATVRETDTLARIGGDEFNIVIADITNAGSIASIARKIMDFFKKPFSITGQELYITGSMGISIYPDDAQDIEDLLRYADIALYYAKEHGRNQYQFYNPVINTRSLERIRFESSLRQAIERGEFIIYYQPQIDIRSRQIVSAEALIRWRHPEMGLLEPGMFMAEAEEIGLITTIDEWVLRSACSQIKLWLDSGLPRFCITVNLSGREFKNPELVSNVSSVLRDTGLSPDCLNIELTESVAMSNIEQTASRLTNLTDLGINISIDHFGTGYSSITHLKRLPIKMLKIDQSFMKDIATDHNDRDIIQAVTAMAHNMRIRVLAGGVETEDQLTFLDSTQCDEAQGYFFSAPLPAEKFTSLLRAA
jgi:diguanylate cyclase (GGDEF)-like protein/PAS domain S-box-containing protein